MLTKKYTVKLSNRHRQLMLILTYGVLSIYQNYGHRKEYVHVLYDAFARLHQDFLTNFLLLGFFVPEYLRQTDFYYIGLY